MMVASQGTIMVARMHMNTKLRPLNSRNEKEKAAILMVTHDAFTASYAKEVYILSDGVIKCKINRGKDRKEFYDRIIDMQASMGGDFS